MSHNIDFPLNPPLHSIFYRPCNPLANLSRVFFPRFPLACSRNSSTTAAPMWLWLYYSPYRNHFCHFKLSFWIFYPCSSIGRMWFYYSTFTVVLRGRSVFRSPCYSLRPRYLSWVQYCHDFDLDHAISSYDNYFPSSRISLGSLSVSYLQCIYSFCIFRTVFLLNSQSHSRSH